MLALVSVLHARTLEVLRPLGVTQPLLARADTTPAADLRLGGRVVRVTFDGLAQVTGVEAAGLAYFDQILSPTLGVRNSDAGRHRSSKTALNARPCTSQ